MRLTSILRAGAACAAVALALTAGPAHAQTATPAAADAGGETAEYRTPLGIGMEEWPYPHTVHFLPLEIEGQEVRMAYMDVAPPGGKVRGNIVLLHGKNFFGAYWQDTIMALGHAGYRVIVPDQIGFGRSSKPDIHYSFDLLSANTARLLDHLKIDRTAVLGHSMGGMLAVRFARRYPERTTHLILENPIGLEDYRMKAPPATLDALIEGEYKQTTEQIRAYRKSYFVNWLPSYERFVEVAARVKLSGEFPRLARASALTSLMIYEQPVRHEFPLIAVPTLLVIGQEDRTAIGRDRAPAEVGRTMGQYPELGRAAARDIPNARLVELRAVGHIPHLEAPDAFHRAVIDFLK